MNFAATESPEGRPAAPCCIVGFGNRYRRDDGVGPWIVEQLGRRLPGGLSVRLVSGHYIGPDLLDGLGDAGQIILIDASAQTINGGWRWEVVESRKALPSSLHVFNPGFLLHLLATIYGHHPEAWLISIQGERFGHGEGLSPLTLKRAGEVMATLEAFLATNGNDGEGNYGDGA